MSETTYAIEFTLREMDAMNKAILQLQRQGQGRVEYDVRELERGRRKLAKQIR